MKGRVMRAPLRSLPPLYGLAAPAYTVCGLGLPLPLPPHRKAPPPAGFTGKDAKIPSAAQLRRWARDKPQHNVGLRLAHGVLGLDVDGYPPKLGSQTLNLGTGRWGPLPVTVRTSSRADGISGIYLYRVHEEVDWPSLLTTNLKPHGSPGHVELVHARLRYAVCWPSVHPEGRRYWWWDDVGKLQEVPLLEDLPYLPPAWVRGLTALAHRPEAPPAAEGAPVTASHLRSRGVAVPPALDQQAAVVVNAEEGQRNEVLNKAAFSLGGDLSIDEKEAETALVAAARKAGLPIRQARASFRSGWSAGRQRPYR